MANHPKLIKLPGDFMGAVERLLNTAPPPKGKKALTAKRKGARKKSR